MMNLAGIFGILRNEDERNMIESSKVYQQYIGSDQNKLRAQDENHASDPGRNPGRMPFFGACFVLTIYLN
ncbi:MAG: hypothetical protein ACI316_00135, partial [Lactimicrobium massiliense]